MTRVKVTEVVLRENDEIVTSLPAHTLVPLVPQMLPALLATSDLKFSCAMVSNCAAVIPVRDTTKLAVQRVGVGDGVGAGVGTGVVVGMVDVAVPLYAVV